MISKVTKYAPKLKDFSLFCIPDPRGDDSEAALKILHGHYIYLILKITDLIDTVNKIEINYVNSMNISIFSKVFFILRKKNNQATFLHIYHHAIMVMSTYLHLKFVSGGGQACSLGEFYTF